MTNFQKKKRAPRLTSPIGEVRSAWIDKPSTKFKVEGMYSCDLRITEQEATALLKQIEPLIEEAKATAISEAKTPAIARQIASWTRTVPVCEEMHPETGDPTGYWILRTKSPAVRKSKDKSRPDTNITIPVYDSSPKPKPVVGAKIGRGSRLRISFDAVPFASPGLKRYGVSCRLIGAQIIELVEWSGGTDAESLGFTGESGGYVAEETDSPPFESSESPTDGGPDSPNF